MSEEARELAQAFYLSCRRSKGFPNTILRALTHIAQAHCRLHLRDVVSVADVLVSIIMIEKSLHSFDVHASDMEFEDLNHAVDACFDVSAAQVYERDAFKTAFNRVLEFIRRNS